LGVLAIFVKEMWIWGEMDGLDNALSCLGLILFLLTVHRLDSLVALVD
jgi:hypothetical protein